MELSLKEPSTLSSLQANTYRMELVYLFLELTLFEKDADKVYCSKRVFNRRGLPALKLWDYCCDFRP